MKKVFLFLVFVFSFAIASGGWLPDTVLAPERQEEGMPCWYLPLNNAHPVRCTPAGDLVLGWSEFYYAHFDAFMRVYSDGQWGAPQRVSRDQYSYAFRAGFPSVATIGDSAFIVWDDMRDLFTHRIYCRAYLRDSLGFFYWTGIECLTPEDGVNALLPSMCRVGDGLYVCLLYTSPSPRD